MATKAELEKELAALKQELEKSRAATEAAAAKPTQPDPEADETASDDAHRLRRMLADHGMDPGTIETLSASLWDELKTLQKEKPVTVAIAAFALGLVVGRASK